jgi:Domain of unknown function (DUF4271)
MIRRKIIFFCFFILFRAGAGAQDVSNPFEMRQRLPVAMALPGQAPLRNPFDVAPHRAPDAALEIAQNDTRPFRPFSIAPRGDRLPASALFWLLLVMFGFLTVSVAGNRSAVGKAWRSFLGDNALALAQREAFGLVGSTPYFLLYGNFLFNAGLFIFLTVKAFKGSEFNNGGFLALCIVGAVFVFLSKHVLILTINMLFPVEKEALRYNFLITVFNCVLGLFLVPFNAVLAFSVEEYRVLLIAWILGLVVVFYLYRGLRALSIGGKFLGTDFFHFLLYLCTVEIAPVLLFFKIMFLQTN